MRHTTEMLVFVALLAPWTVGAREEGRPRTVVAQATCATDRNCDDGRFCNGVERCTPGSPRADARGCMPHDLGGLESVCAPAGVCSEARAECVPAECAGRESDQDGDGHRSLYCDGDDCDDNDRRRYPGNTEICDLEGHDEDCDPSTPGQLDADGDGFNDAACFNYNR